LALSAAGVLSTRGGNDELGSMLLMPAGTTVTVDVKIFNCMVTAARGYREHSVKQEIAPGNDRSAFPRENFVKIFLKLQFPGQDCILGDRAI
jgi:hypothetical protein